MFSHFTQVNPQNQSPHKPKHTPNQSSTTTFIPWHSLSQSLQTHSRWWFNWPFTHTFCHYHRCMLSYHQLNNTTNQHSHQNSSNKSMPKHRICKEHTHTHMNTHLKDSYSKTQYAKVHLQYTYTSCLSWSIVNKAEYHWHWFHCCWKKVNPMCITRQLYQTFRTLFWLLECIIIYLKLSVWFFHTPLPPLWWACSLNPSKPFWFWFSHPYAEHNAGRTEGSQTRRKGILNSKENLHHAWYA